MARFEPTTTDGATDANAGRGATRALLTGVIDYAGLFPPAALAMPDAVAEYAAADDGAEAWMLGRFVVPASRLSEFAEVRAVQPAPPRVWRLSAIAREGAEADRAAIIDFNAATARHHAVVDTIESRPQTLEGIDALAETYGGAFDVYVEVPAGDDAERWLERVGARGLKAKVRTGGLTAEAFPGPSALLAFLEAAVRLRVPFKATAGLHHAVRGSHRLTGDDHAPEATMYGYLNVLLATAALRARLPVAVAADLLCRSDVSSLVFADDAIRWGGAELSGDILRAMRADHLASVGSCSFREPVDELQTLTS